MAETRKRGNEFNSQDPSDILNKKFKSLAFNDGSQIADVHTCTTSPKCQFRKREAHRSSIDEESLHTPKKQKFERPIICPKSRRTQNIVKPDSRHHLKANLTKVKMHSTNRYIEPTGLCAIKRPWENEENSESKKIKLGHLSPGRCIINKKDERRKHRKENTKNRDSVILEKMSELRVKGNDALKDKRFELAINYYTKAFSIEPKFKMMNSLLYSNAGLAFMKLDNYSDAIEHLDKAISLDPKNLKAKRRRILCLKNMNEFEDAEKEVLDLFTYSKSEEDADLIRGVLEYKGDVYQKRGDQTGCHKAYITALYSYSGALGYGRSVELLMKRVEVSIRLGKLIDAIDDVTAAIEISPQNIEMKKMKLEFLELSGAPPKILIDTIIEYQDIMDPEFTHQKLKDIYLKEGIEHGINNKFMLAFESYTKALEHSPDDIRLLEFRAETAFQLGDCHSVINDCSKAIELGSSNLNTWVLRARCLLREGLYKEAYEDASLVYVQTRCPKIKMLVQETEQAMQRSSEETHYEVLNVQNNATSKEIRKQYLKLSLKYHPDKLVTLHDIYKNSSQEKFKKILESYNTLNNPVTRSLYDVSLLRKTRWF